MAGKCPCRGCTERILLCHGRCERYQEWKKEYEKNNRIDYREYPDIPREIKRHIWRKMKRGRG
jgi:hypothetical protein